MAHVYGDAVFDR